MSRVMDLGPYRERCDELWHALEPHGWATARELADETGWSIHEVRAKLVAMRDWDLVEYDAQNCWWKTWNS